MLRALPLVAIMEAPPPKPDGAMSQGKGVWGTTATEPLRCVGGIAGHGDAGGARTSPLTQLKDPCHVSTGIGSQGVEGGAQGGVMAPRHPN
jgi:hypothetical protein